VRHGAKEALDDWLLLCSDMPGPLFWPITKDGRLRPRRLNGQARLYVTRRRGRGARVERFSPHDPRRSFISDLLDAGADLSTAQQLAGHAQV
jgi:integrase